MYNNHIYKNVITLLDFIVLHISKLIPLLKFKFYLIIIPSIFRKHATHKYSFTFKLNTIKLFLEKWLL